MCRHKQDVERQHLFCPCCASGHVSLIHAVTAGNSSELRR